MNNLILSSLFQNNKLTLSIFFLHAPLIYSKQELGSYVFHPHTQSSELLKYSLQ